MDRFLYSTFLLKHSKHSIKHASFIQSFFLHLSVFNLKFTTIHTTLNNLESNLGFRILPKDTLASRLDYSGFEPPTFRLVGNLLYLVIHSQPKAMAENLIIALLL